MKPNGVLSAVELRQRACDGDHVAVAGLVICRQRPGTAKGFVFLTLEDETGMVNVVVTPKRFEQQALLISTTPLLLVRGVLQIEQGVINVRATQFRGLQAELGAEYAKSHDFH
jgi:error-prone DNA polymerase